MEIAARRLIVHRGIRVEPECWLKSNIAPNRPNAGDRDKGHAMREGLNWLATAAGSAVRRAEVDGIDPKSPPRPQPSISRRRIWMDRYS
jgi:hypothetical protein